MKSEYSVMVSVIIPFYHNTLWLEEALQSVLKQSFKDIEIIVINDGSSESMDEFLQKYDNNITYICQNNSGAAAARNTGIKVANGEYIAFLDSDDIWLPNKLEKQIHFMKSTGVQWSHTGYYYWKPESNTLVEVNNKNEYGCINKKTFVSIRIATPCVIIKASLLKGSSYLSFNESYRIGQDTKLWQEISRLYPIGLIKEPLTKVRLRSNNTHKQYLRVIHHRAGEFQANIRNPNVPLMAQVIGFLYYSSSKMLPSQSNSKKINNLAKFSIVPPYILGRAYVKLLNFSNRKYLSLVK